VGFGVQWPTTMGLSDESTIRTPRSIQRETGGTISPYHGRTPSLQSPRKIGSDEGCGIASGEDGVPLSALAGMFRPLGLISGLPN
jgi:hypothetical protein